MYDNLSDVQLLALNKSVATAARKRGIDLSPGMHSVPAFDLRADSGSVSVGQPEDYTPTIKIPLLDTMVIAFHRAGFQRDGIADLILDSATDALNNGDKVGDEIKTTISYVQQEVKDLQARLASGLPAATRKGKTKVTLRGGCEG